MELGIRKAMADKRVTVEAIASILSVHRNTASSKVNGTTPFTIEEGFRLKQMLFPEYAMDFLFLPQKEPKEVS